MATSYPDKTNARGIWTLDDITKNITTGGSWPKQNQGDRALFAGGNAASASDVIDYVSIASAGDAADFGDMITDGGGSVAGSSTRSILSGDDEATNVISYVSWATTGDAADFGDLTVSRYVFCAASNETRAIFSGGVTDVRADPMDYITISTLGDAIDFGNLTGVKIGCSAKGNSTRYIVCAG